MELIQNNASKPAAPAPSDTGLNLQDILQQCLAHWYWFLISLAVVMGGAFAYLLSTPPTYTRTAALLIKDEGKGQSLSSDVGSSFSNMGLFQVNTNINNEIYSLQSSAVMLDVVKRLHLNIDYKVEGTFYPKTVYGSELPYKVEFFDLQDNDNLSFTLLTSTDGQVSLQELTYNGTELSAVPRGMPGDTLSTPAGRILVTPVARREGNEVPPLHVVRSGIYGTVAACSSRLSVAKLNDQSTIINLTFTDVCTQRAEDVLNTLISVYNENWVKDRNQIAVSTSMFINERLAVIERELGNVDEDISSYKSEHLLPDVQTAASMYMAQSSETNAQILALNTQLSMARYIRNYLTAASSRNQLLPANSGIESANIESQISQYNAMQLQRNNLVSNSSEENPLVVDLDQSLKAMRGAIITSIDNLMVTLNTQLQSLRQSEQHTTARLAENPSQGKYLLSVERQQKVKEALYLFLLQKREENELSQAFTAYNSRVITPPNGSNAPTAPVRSTILLIALFIGIALPAGIIVLRVMLVTTIRGRKDLESMRTPFMGEIPQYGSKAKHRLGKKPDAPAEMQFVVKDKSRDIINEAFRVVRTNFEFVTGNTPNGSIIMVTSFNPGSGKTFVTANLASCLAIKGKKVVMVDLDLRRASLSKGITHTHTGISNYLAGQPISVQDILQHEVNGLARLDLVPVGILPPNPTELLVSERLEEFLNLLKQHYDYIFIDCPPVEIVADAAIISKWADMTLFVIRAGLLERSMLPELDRLYDENKYKNLSVILNGTETAKGRYGYHRYGYRYGYNYGYGYGDYANDK